MSGDLASVKQCGERNPWGSAIRPCVRSPGHPGFHRDRLDARWFVGGQVKGWTVTGTSSGQAHPGTTPPPPPPTPPTDREGELARQLDQEREAHARTRGERDRATRAAVYWQDQWRRTQKGPETEKATQPQ